MSGMRPRCARDEVVLPNCIEYGRTSFFCTQDCFTKNWKSHGQLHELLKKKKAMGESGATVGLPDADLESPQLAARPKPSSPTEDMPTSNARRSLAPLAGGMSAFATEKRGINGATQRRPETVKPSFPGTLGGVAGSAWNLVSTPFWGSNNATSTTGAKGTTAAASAGARRLGGAAAQPAVKGGAAQLGGKTPWWSSFTRRFAMNGLLWALALVTIVACGFFYKSTLGSGSDQVVITTGVEDVPDIRTAATAEVRSVAIPEEAPAKTRAPDAASVAAPVLSVLGLGASSPTAAPAESASSVEVKSLRNEIVALRELVGRHDKMLRYVMERYVEKAVTSDAGAGAKDSHSHEVTFESVSVSTNDASSAAIVPPEGIAPEEELALKVEPPHRKRKHGGGDAPSMGAPEIESAPSELQIASSQQAAESKAAGPTTEISVPRAEHSAEQLGLLGAELHN